MMSREWFLKLYNNEHAKLESNIKYFKRLLENEDGDLEEHRKRDYQIYKNCVQTAYENDLIRNLEKQLSWEEKSILQTLENNLELSNEEVRWISHTVIPLEKFKVDDLLNELKESGIIFFNRKTNTLYVPDEFIWLLREIAGIELPNKFLRRILKNLSDPEINLITKKHNINRKWSRKRKIQEILNQGINATNLLTEIIFRPGTSKTDKSKKLHTLMEKGLEVDIEKFGRSLEEKVANLIKYFNDLEKEDTISLSRDGFNSLLKDLAGTFPIINNKIKEEFELQDENVMSSELLNKYNIKPRDILYLFIRDELLKYCKGHNIKSRGNLIKNIIENYRDIDDLYIENFDAIGRRDLKTLHDKGLFVKEIELGLLYEKVTQKIFNRLGFNTDHKLKNSLNTSRHKIDILINLGNQDLMLVECKTKKDQEYNHYTSVSRQLKSYVNLCEKKNYHVTKAIIVANEFSDDFIGACEYDYELNLSLLTSRGLMKILDGFKNSTIKEFPVRLLMRNGLLNEDRIVKVLTR